MENGRCCRYTRSGSVLRRPWWDPSAYALELGRRMALQALTNSSHVHRPEQLRVGQAVHPGPGVVLLGRGAAQDSVGAQVKGRFGRVTMTDIHLDDAGGVSQQQLDLAVLKDPPETELDRQRTQPGSGLIQQPGPALPLQEGTAIMGADDLLAEMSRVNGRVADDAGALPTSDQPCEGREDRRKTDVDFEGHERASCFPGGWRRIPRP